MKNDNAKFYKDNNEFKDPYIDELYFSFDPTKNLSQNSTQANENIQSSENENQSGNINMIKTPNNLEVQTIQESIPDVENKNINCSQHIDRNLNNSENLNNSAIIGQNNIILNQISNSNNQELFTTNNITNDINIHQKAFLPIQEKEINKGQTKKNIEKKKYDTKSEEEIPINFRFNYNQDAPNGRDLALCLKKDNQD